MGIGNGCVDSGWHYRPAGRLWAVNANGAGHTGVGPITVPAGGAEVIATLEVREGQRVKAGAVLMQLDPARGDAQFAVAQADTARRPSWKS